VNHAGTGTSSSRFAAIVLHVVQPGPVNPSNGMPSHADLTWILVTGIDSLSAVR
jgi:hypothetical protein